MQPIPEPLRHILGQARWAPSGDNTQPWRFEVLAEDHVLVHGYDTRDHVVYDLDGHASQLAHGALLETLAIAAAAHGRRIHAERRVDASETHQIYDVRISAEAGLAPEPLAASVEKRVVQRRAMSTKSLGDERKKVLEASLEDGYRVLWFEGLGNRVKFAKFMFDNAWVRLVMPEAYHVHKAVIEWGARYSEDRIPDQAVGVDPLTARFMHWAMARWDRVEFLNKWLMGTLAPRIQLDLLPGLRCAAHFALVAPKPLASVDDYVAAGRAMQRFWLTATSLGLYAQPEMTPVIFTRYHRKGLAFTRHEPARAMVSRLNQRLGEMLGDISAEHLFFMGRIGLGAAPRSRSTRKPLDSLIITG